MECVGRIAREGQFRKFKKTDGSDAKKRCYQPFRCGKPLDENNTSGLCDRCRHRRIMYMQNGYDKQHAMYNWAGIFGQDYPEKHAVFYGSPEYKRLISSGLHIESMEDSAAGATDAEMKPSVKSVPVKKSETEIAEPETEMPRPKKKSAATATTTAPQSPPETEKSATSFSLTSVIRQPVLFRYSRTPYKVHEVEKISRETLEDYIRKNMAENPELNKLFTE